LYSTCLFFFAITLCYVSYKKKNALSLLMERHWDPALRYQGVDWTEKARLAVGYFMISGTVAVPKPNVLYFIKKNFELCYSIVSISSKVECLHILFI
jgi:hypothetical protein